MRGRLRLSGSQPAPPLCASHPAPPARQPNEQASARVDLEHLAHARQLGPAMRQPDAQPQPHQRRRGLPPLQARRWRRRWQARGAAGLLGGGKPLPRCGVTHPEVAILEGHREAARSLVAHRHPHARHEPPRQAAPSPLGVPHAHARAHGLRCAASLEAVRLRLRLRLCLRRTRA